VVNTEYNSEYGIFH